MHTQRTHKLTHGEKRADFLPTFLTNIKWLNASEAVTPICYSPVVPALAFKTCLQKIYSLHTTFLKHNKKETRASCHTSKVHVHKYVVVVFLYHYNDFILFYFALIAYIYSSSQPGGLNIT